MVIEDGDVLELDKDDARKRDKVTAGRILIDSGSSIDVVEELVIKDRRILSEDGIVLAVLAINKRTGKVEQSPEVVMRGFGGADITDQARRRVEAPDPENHRPAADDHAGDPGNLTTAAIQAPPNNCPTLTASLFLPPG
jgi:ribonuclease J